MFEFIRTHQRLMQFLLLLFIFPSFAFVGLEGYSRLTDGDNVVAKVGGQSITSEEWNAAQRQQLDRLRQMFGAQFDAKMFDTPEAKRAVLDNLISQRALGVEANRARLSVSDQTLLQNITSIPGLTKPDGSFDKEQYRMLLGAQGMTPPMYEARLAQDKTLQQLNSAVQGSAFAPKAVAARLSDLNDQERSVQQLTFKAAEFRNQVKVSDEQLKAYYDKNGKLFDVPEQASIQYVVLDSAAVAAQVTVSDADVQSYYDQNAKLYSTPAQRRASHILIAVPKSASAADKAAAKAKADGLVAQLRKTPGDFARLAKANSQDPGSAAQGGDLGYFGKGMMVKPFDDAVDTLKQGEISNPVESEFGYHIIEVTGIKPATVKPLAEVKDEITAAIKKQLAAKKYTELAETFTNTVYEQGDSLQPAADKLKLKLQTATVTRQPDPANASAPFNNPKFLKALFIDDVLKNKHNTEAVEIAPATLIAGHVTAYKPVTRRSFDEVKAQVQDKVILEQETLLATKAGEDKLAALKKQDDATGFGDTKVASRVKTEGWSEPALLAVMKADTARLPAYVGVSSANGDYTVLRITKVAQTATPDAARRSAEQQQVSDVLAQQEMLAYIQVLKERAKTKLLKGAAKTDAIQGAGTEGPSNSD